MPGLCATYSFVTHAVSLRSGELGHPKCKKRRARALRRQEKRWAQKPSEVKVIRPDDLPEDSTLR